MVREAQGHKNKAFQRRLGHHPGPFANIQKAPASRLADERERKESHATPGVAKPSQIRQRSTLPRFIPLPGSDLPVTQFSGFGPNQALPHLTAPHLAMVIPLPGCEPG
jgi:hypothetical protein